MDLDDHEIDLTGKVLIAMPSIGITFRSAQRDLAKAVWRQLGQITDRDWIQYQRIRSHFVNEYSDKLSNVIAS